MKKLFVGNLPYQASESDLQDWLTKCGVTVESINLIRDRTSGEPRGFGFIELGSDDEAEHAIQACNGKDFLGRTLVVNEARPAPDTRSRTGFANRGMRTGRRSW
ncbi:MAG: RNA recognition motif domain-containing protein [Bryobacteraceae bacterium]